MGDLTTEFSEIQDLAKQIQDRVKSIQAKLAPQPAIPVVIPGEPPVDGAVCDAPDIQAAINGLKPGETLNVRPGAYYGTLKIDGKKGCVIRAIDPGTVRISGLWQDADLGKVKWVRKWDAWACERPDTFMASYDDHFLFRYRSVDELKAPEILGHAKPDFGYAYKQGHIFMRLPNDEDPNGKSIQFCNKEAQAIIRVSNSPDLTIDGFAVEGAGNKDAIRFDAKSEAPLVENCVFTHSRRAVRVPHRATIRYCEYTYSGFWNLYQELVKLNGEGTAAMFDLTKKVWTKPGSGNAFLEGGLIETIYKAGSEGVVLENNFMHSVFDGQRLGCCKSVESSHNVYYQCLDNSFEAEHHTDGINAKIHEHHSLILDCPAALCSHQDTNDKGMGEKHYVSHCVIANRDVSGPFLIKLLNVQNDIIYAHCQFEIKAGKDERWGNMATVVAGMRKQKVPSKLKVYNCVVTGDKPTPIKGSPTIKGIARARNTVEAEDVEDLGPIEPHTMMGPKIPDDLTDWPRPMRRAFSR